MNKDTLSALLDGECTAAELDRLLEEFGRSGEMRQAWSRMCLVRDAHEGVAIRRDQDSVCAGVMARLDGQERSDNPVVVPLFRRRVRGYWKPIASLAAAASVAAVAVLMSPLTESPVAPEQTASLASARIPVGGFQPISIVADDTEPSSMNDDLRNYLIEHSNSVANRGMGATLSYARFAAHTVGDPAVQPISFDATGDVAGAQR